jgi:hypothetical protein
MERKLIVAWLTLIRLIATYVAQTGKHSLITFVTAETEVPEYVYIEDTVGQAHRVVQAQILKIRIVLAIRHITSLTWSV